MSRLISLILLVYLIGVGVELFPVARASWNTAPASELVANLLDYLPEAARWPVRVFDAVRGDPHPPAPETAPQNG